MAYNAWSAIIHAYGIVVTDEVLSQRRASADISPRINDDKLRAMILEGLTFNLLIGVRLLFLKSALEA